MKNLKKRKENCNRHHDFRRINLIKIHANVDSTAVQCTGAENVGRGIVPREDKYSTQLVGCTELLIKSFKNKRRSNLNSRARLD